MDRMEILSNLIRQTAGKITGKNSRSSWVCRVVFLLVLLPVTCVFFFIGGWFVFGCNPDDYAFPWVPPIVTSAAVLATALGAGATAGFLATMVLVAVANLGRLRR